MNSVFPEWLNANSGRAYPIREGSSLKDVTGLVSLPNSLILAAQINMPPSYVGGTFFVSSISASASLIIITISYSEGGADRVIANVHVDVDEHTEYDSYAFVGSGQDSSIIGSITIGDVNEANAAIPGMIGFNSSATPFEVSCLFVSSPALEAIQIYNGDDLLGSFNGILKLRAGENVRLSYVEDDPDVIRIDFVDGENVQKVDECENAIPIHPPIRTINGIGPDENGNFTIDGGKCISIDTVVGLLKLIDLCSSSCCGCSELEVLMSGIKQVEDAITQIRSQINTGVLSQNEMIIKLVERIGR